MKLLILTLVSILVISCSSPSTHDAEAVAKQYSDAMAEFDCPGMVELMHPSMIDWFTTFLKELYSDANEKKSILETFSVEDENALQNLSDEEITVKFLTFVFSRVTDTVRNISENSETKIVGIIEEGELVHVLTRFESSYEEQLFGVPSVVTLKLHDGEYRVVSTTHFEGMKGKLK